MSSITIKIQGFDYLYIIKTKKIIEKIKNIFSLKVHKVGIYPLPNKIKKYTVERSPHVYKKSREQFKKKRYKSVIRLEFTDTEKAQNFFYLLKNSIFPGVELKIFIEFQDFFHNKKLSD